MSEELEEATLDVSDVYEKFNSDELNLSATEFTYKLAEMIDGQGFKVYIIICPDCCPSSMCYMYKHPEFIEPYRTIILKDEFRKIKRLGRIIAVKDSWQTNYVVVRG